VKALPPSLRQGRRYILARIDPVWIDVGTGSLYSAILYAATSLYGDIFTARMNPAVIDCGSGYAIIRCRRGTERECATVCSTVTEVDGMRVAIRPRCTSGTIKKLRIKISPPIIEEGEDVIIDGREYRTRLIDRQKVDLSTTGIKQKELLFFTTEDMEE